MGKIVLLAVAAAWAAVLLPPLLRSRLENRPGSSVTDFRRQLSTLQRTVPTRSMTPMRSMARPLAPSPFQRPAVTGRPAPFQYGQSQHGQSLHGQPLHGQTQRTPFGQYGQFQRAHVALPNDRNDRNERHDRGHGEPAYTGELQRRYDRHVRADGHDRSDEHDPADRGRGAAGRVPARRVSQREAVRRRRANVLFMLVAVTATTLFLAATTKSSTMVYAFALAFVSLCGYCYKLAQLRQYEYDRSGDDAQWYHAA